MSDRKAINILHEMAAEIEEAVAVPTYSDRCEIDPAIAKKLLRRYYAWRNKKPSKHEEAQ